MPCWGWLTLVLAVIGFVWALDAWFLPNPVIRPFILRRFGKAGDSDPVMPATEKTSQSIDARLEQIETRLGQIAEYLDGLPETKDKKKRDLFTRGREAQKAYQYTEAIRIFNEILSLETSGSERAALHILIGNCL